MTDGAIGSGRSRPQNGFAILTDGAARAPPAGTCMKSELHFWGDPPLGGFERFEMENRTFCFQTAGGSRDAYPPMGPREPSAKPFSLSDKRTNTKTFLIATFMKSELHFWGPPPLGGFERFEMDISERRTELPVCQNPEMF